MIARCHRVDIEFPQMTMVLLQLPMSTEHFNSMSAMIDQFCNFFSRARIIFVKYPDILHI